MWCINRFGDGDIKVCDGADSVHKPEIRRAVCALRVVLGERVGEIWNQSQVSPIRFRRVVIDERIDEFDDRARSAHTLKIGDDVGKVEVPMNISAGAGLLRDDGAKPIR